MHPEDSYKIDQFKKDVRLYKLFLHSGKQKISEFARFLDHLEILSETVEEVELRYSIFSESLISRLEVEKDLGAGYLKTYKVVKKGNTIDLDPLASLWFDRDGKERDGQSLGHHFLEVVDKVKAGEGFFYLKDIPQLPK